MATTKTKETIVPQEILNWRKKQPKGAIMKPSTFSAIERSAEKKYGIGKKRATKVAGAAYWATVKAKAKARRKK